MGKRTVKAIPKKIAPAKAKAKTPTKSISKAPKKPTLRAAVKTTKKALPPAPKKVATPKKTAVKKAPKGKKPKAQSGPKGFSAVEYETFKSLKDKFSGFSNQSLKDLLRKNMQSMTGNKDELVFKCADGATLGRIPRCPKCFGGRYLFANLDLNSTSRRALTTVQAIAMTLIFITARVPSSSAR